MSDVFRRRAEEVFQQVADLPPEQRTSFLDQHCPNESGMRAEVESLLVHLDNETIVSLQTASYGPAQISELPGERIGPYKLLQLIGEGGFGSVYMAEQDQPVRRKVALKIIKLGMDTRQVIARFEAERQALALMEHPNIAKVLDAGETETGRPYFVMELVRGIPVTEYSDRNSLSTPDRLELFMRVCRAVQHAHQKGVIHRDIKPTNVLVTMHDGTPVPKVIDFGIAKATSQRLTEKTLFTEFMQFIGTPQYMSPEQAEMSGLDVDTRTDVYSLGVLLYELLTGTTPFNGDTLRSAPYTEIQRIIREQDPPTPSKRLSTLGDQLAEVARSRCSEPQALSKLIRGDLDWIVMKALEKDRARRYETAAALAADIQHHLNNEPVAAGPPGAGYKFRKFIRRHQVSVVAGSLIAAALLMGLALATVGFVQASHERDRALAAEQLAQDEAENVRAEAKAAKAINAFFNDMLTSVDPMQVGLLSAFAPDERVGVAIAGGLPRGVSVAEMVRQAATDLDQAFAGKPELEAASRETIGMTLRGLGLFADARPQLRAALDIRRQSLGNDHPDTLRSALALGDLMLEAGMGAEAEPLVRSALVGMDLVYGGEHPKTLSCAAIMAQVLSDQGKYKESEEIFRQTLELQRQTLGPEHRDTLATMWKWSVSYLSQWKLTKGQTLAHELHDIAAKTLGPDDSLNILSKPLMGWCYLKQYQYGQAEAVFRPGLEQCRRILGPKHPVTYMTMHGLARSLQGANMQDQKEQLYREALAGLRATRGRLHRHTISVTADFARWLDRRGDFAQAEQLFQALVADWARSLGEEHNDTLMAMSELAAFLERVGKFDQAIAVRHERLAVIQRLYGEQELVNTQSEMEMLAQALVRMGRIEQARDVTRKLLALLRGVAEKKPKDYTALNNYAWALLICVPVDLRDVKTATPVAEKAVKLSDGKSSPILDTLALAYHLGGFNDKAVDIQRKSLELLSPEQRKDLLYSANLVRYLLKQGDTAAAERAVLDGVEMFREVLGEDNPMLASQLNRSGVSLAEWSYYSMAEGLLREAVDLNRKILGDDHEQVAASLKNLADIYRSQGKYDLAEPVYREALVIRRRLLGDDDVSVARTMHALSITLCDAGDAAAAATILREVLGTYQKLDAEDIPAALETRCSLAQALVALGKLEEAEPLARDALAKTRASLSDGHLSTAQAAGTLGYCLLAQQRFDEADPLLLRSCNVIQAAKGGDCTASRTARERLVALYQAWGKPEQAARWKTEPATTQPSTP